MIYTSYFANLKKLPNNIIPISICGKAPDWYKGLQYKKLAPKYGFFMEWKKNQNNDYYIEHFDEEVLKPLNTQDVLYDIWNLLSDEDRKALEIYNCLWWNNPDIHVVLVCYEKPTDFCHRHLVADWLTKNGIKCVEYIV